MRPTGIALAVVGMVIIVFSLISSLAGSGGDAQPRTAGGFAFPDLTVPMFVAFAAIVIGTAMYLFGGRGYRVTRNPAVRN